MINNWKALGEVLADFENRLSVLESSVHMPKPPQDSVESLNKPVGMASDRFPYHDAMMQTKTLLRDLENRLNQHIDDSKVKRQKSKYT